MRLLVLLLLTLALANPSLANSSAKESVTQAVSAYQSALDEQDRDRRIQMFRRSEILFAQAIQDRLIEAPNLPIDADLYANLGNAALGAERIGPAVLAYRRALYADPSHRRTIENLEYARSQIPDWVPRPEQNAASFGSLIDGVRQIRPSNWYGISAILFTLSMLMVALYIRSGATVARNMAVAGCLTWIVALVWAALAPNDPAEHVAVVITPEVVARSADSNNAAPKFRDPLPGGTEVRIIEDRVDWIRVQLFDGREAWVPTSAITPVIETVKE